MNKKSKTKLLEKTIYKSLEDETIIDGDLGGGSEDEVALWILKMENNSPVIYCLYFTWYEKSKAWVEDRISEIEGPALLNCPVRFFKHKFDPEDVFEAWRYEVKKHHEGLGPEVQNDQVARRLADSLKKRYNMRT